MKVALFYYDGFAEFEIVLASLFLHHKYDILSIALEKREYRSEEQQRFCVDMAIKEVDVDAIDLLVIPGGEPLPLIENQELKRFVEDLVGRNKKISGICGGAMLLAGLGILKGKKWTGGTSGVDPNGPEAKYYAGSIISDEHVVVDGNIITAQGQAHAEFAVELMRQMGLCKTQEEYDEGLKWCKNIR
jgi:putative intracellular protease/amidase